jgi:hypothetical protein
MYTYIHLNTYLCTYITLSICIHKHIYVNITSHKKKIRNYKNDFKTFFWSLILFLRVSSMEGFIWISDSALLSSRIPEIESQESESSREVSTFMPIKSFGRCSIGCIWHYSSLSSVVFLSLSSIGFKSLTKRIFPDHQVASPCLTKA